MARKIDTDNDYHLWDAIYKENIVNTWYYARKNTVDFTGKLFDITEMITEQVKDAYANLVLAQLEEQQGETNAN